MWGLSPDNKKDNDMKIRIIVSGNRHEVMGLLNKLMECHGRDAKVAEVFPQEESLRVDKIVPKQAC